MQVKQGDKVRVHYTGKLTSGEVFDSSEQRGPLEFTVGNHDLIEGFEKAVIGMQPGEKKSVQLGAEEAYGSYDNNLVSTIDRALLPPDLKVEEGSQLQIEMAQDQIALVTVTKLSDKSVTLDANHPLAGKELEFDIHLLSII